MLLRLSHPPAHFGLLLVALILCAAWLLPGLPSPVSLPRAHAQGFGPTVASGGDVTMRIDFGFDGRFRAGYWTPMRIALTNGGAPKEAVLSVITRHGSPLATLSNTTTYRRTVQLPTGPNVIVELYPLVSNAYHPLRVELRDRAGALLASTTLDLTRRVTTDALVVALDASGQEWSWLPLQLASTGGLRGRLSGLSVAYVQSPQALPSSWIAYRGVSAIAVSSSFPLGSLSDAQTQAIATWIEAGGTLIWAGGHRTQAAHSPLAQLLMPMQLSGTTRRVLSGAPITRYPPFPEEADVIVWNGEPGDASIVAQSDGNPLVVRSEYGKGSSLLMTFDPSVLTRYSWDGLGDLARDAMAPVTLAPSSLDNAEAAVWSYIKGVRLPHVPRVIPGVLGLAYILALAITVWLAHLGKLRRLGTLVVILGLATLVSATSVMILNPLAESARHRVAEVHVTVAEASGYGDQWSYYGMWSHSASSWHLSNILDGWTQAPTQLLSLDAPDPDLVLESAGTGSAVVHLSSHTFGRFLALSPSKLDVKARLTLESQEYRLHVQNGATSPIDILYYVHPSQFAYLGALSPGDHVQHAYAAGLHTSGRPSPEWMGTAVANDLGHRELPDFAPHLPSLVEALVVQRLQQGPANLPLDDGFLIGITQADTDVAYAPAATTQSMHVFLLDIGLSGSTL